MRSESSLTRLGKLIVIEGAGGVGKTTQVGLLVERLRQQGYDAQEISFPQYHLEPYGPVIRDYLDGAYGDPNQIHPDLIALLYAQDRQNARPWLEEGLKDGCLFVASRYVASNAAYQAVKLPEDERADWLDWLLTVEYERLRVVWEDVCVVLLAEAEVSARSIDDRAVTTGLATDARDGHERDLAHLRAVGEIYRQLAHQLPDWHPLEVTDRTGQKLRPRDEVQEDIWRLVAPYLPPTTGA